MDIKKHIKKHVLYTSLIESYLRLKNILFLTKSALVELMFFFVFSISYTFFSLKIVDLLNSINLLVSSMSASMPLTNETPSQEAISALLAQKEAFTQYFNRLVFLVGFLLFCVYVLWCLFQGINWWISHKHIGNKVSFVKYMIRFSLFSFSWAIMIAIFSYLLIQLSGIFTIGGVEVINVRAIAYLIGIISLVVMYFAFISYSLLHKSLLEAVKGMFHVGIRKWMYVVPAFILILVKMFVLYKFLMLLNFDVFYTVIIGLAFFIPLIIWARVFMGVVVRNVHKKVI